MFYLHAWRTKSLQAKHHEKTDNRKINVIIAVYRDDAVELMEEFKQDFADLVEDPKVNEEFKSFGIQLDCIKKKA